MAKINNKTKHLKIAKSVIEEFDLDEKNYTSITKDKRFIIKNNNQYNGIYKKEEKPEVVQYTIDFFNTKNCKVYIGKNVRGKIHIQLHHDNSIVYIGNNCVLRKIVIDSNQKNDLIAIGNDIFVNIYNEWRSGLRAGKGNPAIIIGDACLFSANIHIRTSDAHPIYSIESEEQLNFSKSLVLIEPHVWISEGVKILKDVTIGACSIVGLGSIVTKDIKRFSIAKGIPAVGKVDKNIYWSNSMKEDSREKAKYYMNKYLLKEKKFN